MFEGRVGSEEASQLDERGSSNEGVHDVGKSTGFAEDRSHEIEAGKAHKAPVESADDQQDASDQVELFHLVFLCAVPQALSAGSNHEAPV